MDGGVRIGAGRAVSLERGLHGGRRVALLDGLAIAVTRVLQTQLLQTLRRLQWII